MTTDADHRGPRCADPLDAAPSWAGCQVRFNTQLLSWFGDRVQFRLPEADLTVGAVGTICYGSYVFKRFYLGEREGFVELCCESDRTVSRSLFMKDMEEFPHTEAQWDVWLAERTGRLGSPVLLHGDHDYRRVWKSSERWVRPITLLETVSPGRGGGDKTVERQCQLYGRTILAPLGSGRPEFDELLLLQSDGRSVEMFVGMALPTSCYEVAPP